MKKHKIFISFLFAMIIAANMSTMAFAAEKIPVIDDTKDFSNEGEITYTYEGDYVIQSYELTDEEIKLGQDLQKLHIHNSNMRHTSQYAHTHSIKNIGKGTSNYTWFPSEMWTRNSQTTNNEATWPTVAWTTSESITVSKSVNTSVGVTDSVVSAELGANYTKNHTISTSTTRTFKVPYKKEGRIKVTYSRPYRSFTCVTTYVVYGPPERTWTETGSGSALGKPTNIVCDLQTRSY